MKRGILVGVAGISIVIAGLTGCSSNKSNTSSSGTGSPSVATATGGATATVTTGGASVGSGASTAKVTIDGQDQNVQGSVSCVSSGGKVSIAIGGAQTGIGAVLSDANPPVVQSVGLGNVNGVNLAYSQGSGQGSAEATKDGNAYKITGTAIGVDMSNPTAPVSKPFEIDVTCP